MYRVILCVAVLTLLLPGIGSGQDLRDFGVRRESPFSESFANNSPPQYASARDRDWLQFESHPRAMEFSNIVVRAQNGGGASGGGAGASAATDPSAILTQFQIQNTFTAETYDASGYSNTVILQPVLPFPVAIPGLRNLLPNHIIRPTLPIISPSADPDGPLGVQGGLGDLTVLDIGVRNVEGFGTFLFGYTAILPTATDPKLGLREWQLGPAAGLIYKEIPKTIVGFLYQQPFSFQSDAQQILIQPIVVRQLEDNWYVGWGV